MAGYSKVYFVGSTGGFMGADGLARPFFQILVGHSDREWLEPAYEVTSQAMVEADENEAERLLPKPIGAVRSLVPAGSNDPVALLDAVIAFFPTLFRFCPSLAEIERKLATVELLDFHFGTGVPKEWLKLREEALPVFRDLAIFEAELNEVNTRRIPSVSNYSSSA